MKKDWKVTLSYDVKHKDTYLIQNETKEDAIYIAENQNTSPRYDCTLIKEDESDTNQTVEENPEDSPVENNDTFFRGLREEYGSWKMI